MVSSGYCTSCIKVVRLTYGTEGRELVTGGSSPGAAGREIGVCASTVRKWVRHSGLGPSCHSRRGGVAGVVAAEVTSRERRVAPLASGQERRVRHRAPAVDGAGGVGDR